MKETIYLRVSRNKVEQMTKGLPSLYKGEIPIKLNIEVKPEAFREPVIEQSVTVEDWTTGIDMADIDLNQSIITDKEAELIKKRRLAKMADILQQQGFTVSAPEDDSHSEIVQ